jgi:hypothetical protein
MLITILILLALSFLGIICALIYLYRIRSSQRVLAHNQIQIAKLVNSVLEENQDRVWEEEEGLH